MPEALNIHEPLLINTIGHSAGVLIFGALLVLLIQSKATLPALAALFALLWNAGSLMVLSGANTGFWATFSFCSLSLLPPVLLSVALGNRGRGLQNVGWVLGAAAVVLHLAEQPLHRSDLHQAGLLVITFGFAGLALVAGILFRVLTPLALLVFATSFVHFGEGAGHVWSEEIALHHAGIPLALYIVLQDYRFLLMDAFLRSIASGAMAVAFLGAAITANGHWHLLSLASGSPFYAGLISVTLCVGLIVFAGLHSLLQQWLTERVFRRRSVESTVRDMLTLRAEDERQLIELLAGMMAKHVSAGSFEIRAGGALSLPRLISWSEVEVPLRFATIILGRRTGGRRYLSEDLHDLSQLAMSAAARVERFRTDESERLAVGAELRALQAQINPHFLFNSLNALYGTIPRQAADARRTVLNLADMFRYFLQTDRNMIALEEELRIVRAYLEIEQLRLGDRLTVIIDVDPEAATIRIPTLSVQPLVENAVRHGVSSNPGPGTVALRIRREGNSVRVEVEDTGPGFPAEANQGVGLDNVRQRLRLTYGDSSALDIKSTGSLTTVSFSVCES